MNLSHYNKDSSGSVIKRELVLKITAKYLILPVQDEGVESNVRMVVEGKTELDYSIVFPTKAGELAWFAFFSIEKFRDKNVRILVDSATEYAVSQIRQVDIIPGSENFYSEQFRPQYHFTSKTGWLNDPNGLIWYKGEYHMYYQHNPTSLKPSNMTWGHAVSKDLVCWREEPKVLFPNGETGTCFSGAAFIDYMNQLDRKTGEEDVIVLFYLRTNTGLCLAYSNDCGQTFTDYESNPVITHEGARIDTPRPFWYESTKSWITPTYDFFTNSSGDLRRCVGFYSSKNLVEWKFESRVEQDGWGDELCGCVDFFRLPLDGNQENQKWVMILIDGSYIVGEFDGHQFLNMNNVVAVTADRIRSLVVQGNYYATMTWYNMPDGRRIQIAWMRNSSKRNRVVYPQMPFNQQMNFPAELSLYSTKDGPRLRMIPIEEIKQLRTVTHEWSALMLNPEENLLSTIEADLIDIELEFLAESGGRIAFNLREFEVSYDVDSRSLSSCETSARLSSVNGVIQLRILLDRSSLEVYGNNGEIYIPHVVFPQADDRFLSMTCASKTKIDYLRVHEMRSSWDNTV